MDDLGEWVHTYRSAVWSALATVGVDRDVLLPAVFVAALLCFVCMAHFLYMTVTTLDGIPGPTPWPLVGNLWLVRDTSRFFEVINRLHRAFGPIVRIWVGPDEMVLISDPPALKKVLSTEMKAYDRSSKEIERFNEFLGGGLILQPNGAGWKTQRKVLAPAFKHDALRGSALPVVLARLERVVERLDRAAAAGEVIDLEPVFAKLTFGVICDLAGMPVAEPADADALPRELEAFNYICGHCQWRFFCPVQYWRWFKTKAVRRFDADLAFLQTRIRERLRAAAHDTSMIGCLAAGVADGSLTEANAVQQVQTILFAGHDTTSAMLSFAVYFLATDDDERERVEAEIADACGDAGELTYDMLSQLDYTTCALKETLRLRPSAPARSRELTQDVEILNEKLPAGTTVAWSAYAVHMDPDTWEYPESFEPSRFRDTHHPFAFLPFGAGPRRCIGEPLAMLVGRAALATLLRRYSFAPVEGQTAEASMALTIAPRGGMRTRVRRL